jgi:hypothetical protein
VVSFFSHTHFQPPASLSLSLVSSIPTSLISLSLFLCRTYHSLSRYLSLSRASLPMIYFFCDFLDSLFSKLDLYALGSQIHQRTTPPGSWAFQLSAATSCAIIRPSKVGACSSRTNRSSSKPPLFFFFCYVFLFIFTIFLDESSSSSIQTLSSRA